MTAHASRPKVSNLVVIWNSGSGRADQVSELRTRLSQYHTNWIAVDETDDLVGDLKTALEQPCVSETSETLGQSPSDGRKKSDVAATVLAAGGDGTVNATVNALMSIDESVRPAMGIIPLGTANDFARSLRVPDTIEGAVELLESTPVGVDVVKMHGLDFERYFANIAAGGNCVRVSEAMTDEVKSRWGAFSYIRGAVDVLPDMRTYRVQVKCDGECFDDFESWAILVANGKTNAGGIEVAHESVTHRWSARHHHDP